MLFTASCIDESRRIPIFLMSPSSGNKYYICSWTCQYVHHKGVPLDTKAGSSIELTNVSSGLDSRSHSVATLLCSARATQHHAADAKADHLVADDPVFVLALKIDATVRVT